MWTSVTEPLRNPQKPTQHSHALQQEQLKVNHSFPLSLRLNYRYGMLQLVILLLSRDMERLQITHLTQTSQLEFLHPIKEKSLLETRKMSYHLLCTLSMPLFHQTKRKVISLWGCKAFSPLLTKEQSSPGSCSNYHWKGFSRSQSLRQAAILPASQTAFILFSLSCCKRTTETWIPNLQKWMLQ